MFKFVIVACLCAAVLVQGQAPEDTKQQNDPPPPQGPPSSGSQYTRVARDTGMSGRTQVTSGGQTGMGFNMNAGASMGAGLSTPMQMGQRMMGAAQGMIAEKSKRAAEDLTMPPIPSPTMPPMPEIPQ